MWVHWVVMSNIFLTEGHSKGMSGVTTQSTRWVPLLGPGPCASSALLIVAKLLFKVAVS